MTRPAQQAPAAQDRHLRIELLRLQAGYQRLAVRQSACRLAGALKPEALAAQAGDHLRATGLGWLGTGLRLWRRYPLMGSLLGSALGAGGRRRVALKTALVAGLIWLARRASPDRSDT
ncbi:hypothetical protein [Castellaniella sp.]|uniref:hypothetical protein n=1 Tax=Castellaniella sp. TaxID=1955812 RepID=UPI002AFF5704|nr:hypothetical protein [Castellaniella sp.]